MVSLIVALLFGVAASVHCSPMKIVGGSTVANNTFAPYQVSLQSRALKHFCGGSIINKYWILTAGHCVCRKSKDAFFIRVGSISINGASGVYIQPDRIICHPEYSNRTGTNDIALVKTAIPMQFNDHIKAIPIESTKKLNPNEKMMLTGWGLTSHPNGKLPNNLQLVHLSYISSNECRQELLKAGKEIAKFEINESHICTKGSKGVGACMGDSGGPLVYDGVLFGVVSWGIPCARGRPDVYTRVQYFKSFIQREIDYNK
ncbi:hypothetical protein ACFFRR_006356 [Megaselia abdita]